MISRRCLFVCESLCCRDLRQKSRLKFCCICHLTVQWDLLTRCKCREMCVQGPKGSLKPLAGVAEGLIDEALKLDPHTPLALHLHIHIAEASSTKK